MSETESAASGDHLSFDARLYTMWCGGSPHLTLGRTCPNPVRAHDADERNLPHPWWFARADTVRDMLRMVALVLAPPVKMGLQEHWRRR
jgi:hypothetical protein